MAEQPPDPQWAPPSGTPDPYAGYGPPPPAPDPNAGYGAPQQQYPQQGYQQPYGYQQQYAYDTGTKTNGFSIASLVLGIVWVWWIGSILAVVFGHIALSQINKSQGRETGRGLAIAGLVLGYIGVATLIVVIIVAAVNPDAFDS